MMCFFQSWCVCYVTAIVSAILEMALTGFKLVFWKSMAVLSTPKLVYIPWIIYNAFILNASVKMSLETTNCLLPFKSNNHLCSVQSLSRVQLFVTPWTAARQASLFITNSQNLLKLMSIELVMPSNHLILCCPLLPPAIFLSIGVFSSESVLRIRWPKYWSFSFSIRPSIEYSGLISFKIDWLDLLAV